MSKYVDISMVKRMLGLIQASIDDGDGFDQREWLDFVEQMPSVDAVPVASIEEEIRFLMTLGNPFSTMMSLQLSGMLHRWKERDGNEGI